MMQHRREFLRDIGAATVVAGLARNLVAGEPGSDRLGRVLPQRPLGKTGVSVTAFCLGGAHTQRERTEDETRAIIERALELGVRFFDNAPLYGDGEAERRYGLFLTPKYRGDIFLMTKSRATTVEAARKDLERSLSLMRCDQLDLWQIHMISSPEDVDTRIENGVLDFFLEMKAKGKTRHIGFTGHVTYKAHLRMLERLASRGIDLDTCQMPMNLCDPHHESFVLNVLPKLVERRYGVLGMKTMAGGGLLGKEKGVLGAKPSAARDGVTVRDMHEYVYSLPVASLVSGCESPAEVEQNVGVLLGFQGFDDARRERMLALTRPHAGSGTERYKGAVPKA